MSRDGSLVAVTRCLHHRLGSRCIVSLFNSRCSPVMCRYSTLSFRWGSRPFRWSPFTPRMVIARPGTSPISGYANEWCAPSPVRSRGASVACSRLTVTPEQRSAGPLLQRAIHLGGAKKKTFFGKYKVQLAETRFILSNECMQNFSTIGKA